MSERLLALAQTALAEAIAAEEIDLAVEDDEVQIIADTWTLMLQDAPLRALIAIDDESDDPAASLASALNEDDLACIRRLNEALEGGLPTALAASPDPLTCALAALL